MKYRVWWSTSGVLKYYYVDSIEQAVTVITTLSLREVDDESVDFNFCGLEVKNKNDWEEYYDEDGCDISDIIDNNYPNSFNEMRYGRGDIDA